MVYVKMNGKLKRTFWPISFSLLLLQLKSSVRLGREGGFCFPALCIQQQNLYSFKCLIFPSKYYQTSQRNPKWSNQIPPPQTQKNLTHPSKKKPTPKQNQNNQWQSFQSSFPWIRNYLIRLASLENTSVFYQLKYYPVRKYLSSNRDSDFRERSLKPQPHVRIDNLWFRIITYFHSKFHKKIKETQINLALISE